MDALTYIIDKFKLLGAIAERKYPIVITVSRFKGFIRTLNELGFKVGAEIGVSKGRYSRALFDGIPGLKLYCVDPWEAYDDYVEKHTEKGQEELNEYLEITKERLKEFNYEIVRKYSVDAAKDFADESLDFVFIDGNHSFEFVVDDIAAWSKKVKKGGIIAGHDYWNSPDRREWDTKDMGPEDVIKLCQVRDAVDAWTKTNRIEPWFVINGDKCPSWFFVK